MDRAGQTAAFALAFLLTAWATSATATQPDTGSESAALRLKAFELAYNLDYNEAVAALNRAIALDPSNPANQRALAGVTWLQTLFSRGAVIIDFYIGGSFKPRVKMEGRRQTWPNSSRHTRRKPSSCQSGSSRQGVRTRQRSTSSAQP